MLSAVDISLRLGRIHNLIPEGIQLVAVSKFQPVDALKAAYNAGQRLFGESRVQELLEKIPLLPADIKWHFIGHLQTNKVKALIGKTTLIESVDSERLLNLIDTESKKADVITNVLLQVHVAEEETKFGFSVDELLDFFNEKRYLNLSNVRICGLMAMATNTSDMDHVRKDFATTASLFRTIASISNESLNYFDTLSMGMSDDWPIAVEEGSTLIRVGSAIFGQRQ